MKPLRFIASIERKMSVLDKPETWRRLLKVGAVVVASALVGEKIHQGLDHIIDRSNAPTDEPVAGGEQPPESPSQSS